MRPPEAGRVGQPLARTIPSAAIARSTSPTVTATLGVMPSRGPREGSAANPVAGIDFEVSHAPALVIDEHIVHVPDLPILESKLVAVFPTNADLELPTHQAVIVAFDPDTGEHNPQVLRTVARVHGNLAGVYCAVLVEGMVRKGDSVELVD